MMGINYVNYFYYMIWLIKYFDFFIFFFCYIQFYIFLYCIRYIYGNFKVYRNVYELLFNDCCWLNVCRLKLLCKVYLNKMKYFFQKVCYNKKIYVYNIGNEIYDVVFLV